MPCLVGSNTLSKFRAIYAVAYSNSLCFRTFITRPEFSDTCIRWISVNMDRNFTNITLFYNAYRVAVTDTPYSLFNMRPYIPWKRGCIQSRHKQVWIKLSNVTL